MVSKKNAAVLFMHLKITMTNIIRASKTKLNSNRISSNIVYHGHKGFTDIIGLIMHTLHVEPHHKI